MSSKLRCLVTMASGYIGGRLVPELLRAGHAVRHALEGVDIAYYLIHSLGSASFEQRDRIAAGTFAAAAKAPGVQCIVYLGGSIAMSELVMVTVC